MFAFLGEKIIFITFSGNKLKIRVNVEDARQVLLGGKEEMVENALVILKSKYEKLFPKVIQKLEKSLYNFIILGSRSPNWRFVGRIFILMMLKYSFSMYGFLYGLLHLDFMR